jgi:hypothetical protein
MTSTAEFNPILRIVALAAVIMGALFALSALEEFLRTSLRTDPWSSNSAGFVFALLGVALFGVARVARSARDRGDRLLPLVRSANPLLARLIASGAGQVGMAIFIAGIILSILAAAILRLNIYSLVLFAGFPLIIVGLAWNVVMTFVAGVARFHELRAELRSRQPGQAPH